MRERGSVPRHVSMICGSLRSRRPQGLLSHHHQIRGRTPSRQLDHLLEAAPDDALLKKGHRIDPKSAPHFWVRCLSRRTPCMHPGPPERRSNKRLFTTLEGWIASEAGGNPIACTVWDLSETGV